MKLNWTTKKPKIKEECLLLLLQVTARGSYYSVFQMLKNECEGKFYYAVVDHYGDEWGAYEDLTADLYCILPLNKLK